MTPPRFSLCRLAAGLLLLLGGCAAPSQSSRVAIRPPLEARASDSKDTEQALAWPKLEVLGKPPAGRLFVEVRGPNFAKTGYVVWSEGLRIEAVEAAAGYVSNGAPLVEVTIFRDGKPIFRSLGPERRRKADDSTPVPPRAKPDAPVLQPGDRVVAHELIC